MNQSQNHTKENWMNHYGIVEEGPIVSEEDLFDSDTEEERRNQDGICI